MEAVASAWDSVDWERLQARIETETCALGERQDDSEERRKRLVEESNAYRERANKETRKLAVPLIKAFQQECDGLIARSQSAESALIDICSQLTNLPDPKTLLKGAEAWKQDADKTRRAVEERESLKKQLQQTQLELADLRNQDVELRKLKGQIAKRETEHELLIDDTIEEVEKRLRDEFDIRLDEMNLKNEKIRLENENLERKVHELEAKNRESQRKLDVARAAVDQKEVLESEQLEIAYKDLDDANHKIVRLEEQVAQLTAELEKATNGGTEKVLRLGGLIEDKDDEITNLHMEKQFTERRLEEEIQKWREKAMALEKERNKQDELLAELNAKLTFQSDYESLKKEINLLREIEFGESGSNSNGGPNSVETIDRLLADKNKRLQNENASLRMMNEGYKGENGVVSVGKEYAKEDDAEEIIEINDEKEEEEEGKELDLLSLLRRIKDDTTEKVKQPKVVRSKTHTVTPTHTITTTALPSQDSFDDSESLMNEETELKLGNLFGLATKSSSENANGSESETIEKMQNRIQHNVNKLGSRSLNTLEIARQCKKLMVSYNIGQRLFAKHVMNQVVKSQGSLSELLSKPRHWSKLTDKGREAFRRIYGWISDDQAIDLLCSLSPRRVWPSEHKIDHPIPETLWECNSGRIPVAEETSKETPKKPASAREDQYRLAGTSQSANSSSSLESRSSPSKVPTSNGSAIVTPVRLRDRSRESVLSSPTMVSGGGLNSLSTPIRSSRWRHDDISKEKIKSIFETEMAKLKQQESSIEKAITGKPSSTPSSSSRRLSTVNVSSSSTVSASHDNALTDRARISLVDKIMKQRIASGLLPVTQQQYETYESLDTENLVKQIKEFLTVNSISQRQFGEFVLGLSQGSVSDLLARPKTWQQLTQKGREPFIRMQLFLDDVAVEGEVQKRTSSCNSSDKAAHEPNVEMVEEKEPQVPHIQVLGDDSELAKTLASILNGQNGTNEDIQPMKDIKVEPLTGIEMMMQMENNSNVEGIVIRVDGNGEEILDTYELVHRVKIILEENAISCRTFGENYLKCASNVCADVFLRTKPYETSKLFDKQVYRRMKQFLEEGSSAILQLIHKESLKETVKDKTDNLFIETPSSGASSGAGPARVLKRKSSVDSQDDDFEPKKPIQRTVISEHQKDTLRFVFVNEQHPSQEICEMLANKMDMSVRTVQNWFHNHRTRTKAREREGKVYSDALPSSGSVARKSNNWRKELDSMLASGRSIKSGSSSDKWLTKLVESKTNSTVSAMKSQSSLKLSESPTMVNLSNNNNIINNKPKKSLADLLTQSSASNGVSIKKATSGTLDKLVAKMRQMQEAASSSAS